MFTLLRRNAIVKVRDRAQMIILGLQSPLIAALIVLVYGKVASSAAHLPAFQEMSASIIEIDFLMVVAAIWFGCNNAARDIVGEWTIFYRERMVNLKLPSYVLSKFALLLLLSLLQCVILLAIVYFVPACADFFASTSRSSSRLPRRRFARPRNFRARLQYGKRNRALLPIGLFP